MKSELLFNGTPAHFGVIVRQFDGGRNIFQVETQDIARRLNNSLKELFEDLPAPSPYFPELPEIPSDTGIIYVSFGVLGKVSIRPGSSFGSLFGYVTAQVAPNSCSILFVELDEEYPELAQIWDELRTELERHGFIEQPGKIGEKTEIEQFKFLVERQTYRDIFVNDKPQEYIARGFLQTFLIGRSYREVQVRGGQTDLLLFSHQGRFLYETKIWRGADYYQQGLRELEEYIIGENDNQELQDVFYVLFDPTPSKAAQKYLGSDLTTVIVSDRNIQVVVINIALPRPSKKKQE